MKLEAKSRLLAMQSLSFGEWKRRVLKDHKNAKFTLEDGTGKTYGETGDWTAHVGRDMQSDVVGVYSWNNDVCWYQEDGEPEEYGTEGTPVTSSLSNPLNDGAAFETLIDGDPSDKKPVVQEFTEDDGGIVPFDENLLLQDDIQYRLS